MSNDKPIDIRDFIHDDEVVAFVMEHVDMLMPWDRFKTMDMPAGLSPETMWEVMEFVRLTGSHQQMPLSRTSDEDAGGKSWYGVPSKMSSLLARLVFRGRTFGELDTRLEQHHDARRRHPFLVADLSAALTRDGLDVDPETIIMLLAKEKDPVTPEERLLANVLDILESLDAYRTWDFDSQLYDELQARLDEGCESMPYKPLRRPPTSYNAYGGQGQDDPLAKYSQEQKKWCIDFISTHINPCQFDCPAPIIAIVITSDLICEERPFPRWNAFMEIVLRKLSFDRIGMRALASVPFSRALLDWELGLPPANDLPFAFGHAIFRSRYGINATPYLMQLLQFFEQGLDDIERETNRMATRFDNCRSALERDWRLNHRQRKLLMRFVMKPSERIDSAAYENEHDVTLATARADLKKLVRMGYLQLGTCGKKQVFSPVPRMERVILEHDQALCATTPPSS